MTPEEKKLIKARKLVAAVNRLAKKQGLNFFIVTDGASGISNNGNPAVRNAREAQIKWELEHGADQYEDWSKKVPKSISFPEDEIEYLKNRDSIITHRISAERGKYNKGDEVVVPWGDKYVVSDRSDLASVEDSPYKEYLTPEQKKELMKKKIALLTLSKKAELENKAESYSLKDDPTYEDTLKVFSRLDFDDRANLVPRHPDFLRKVPDDMLFDRQVVVDGKGDPVGFQEFYSRKDKRGRRLPPHNIIAIAPEARGNGLVKIMVEAAIRKARKEKVKRLLWEAFADNEPSIRAATSAGFEDATPKNAKGYRKFVYNVSEKKASSLDLKKLFPNSKFSTKDELKEKEKSFSVGDRVKVSDHIRCLQKGHVGTIVRIDPEDKHGWKSFIVEFDDKKCGSMGFSSGNIDKVVEKKAQAVDHDKWPAFSDYQKKHHDDIVRAVRKIVRDDYMRRGNWGLKLDNGKLVGGEKVISDNDIVDKAVIRAGLEARRARRANCHELAASILDKLIEKGVVARRLLVDKDQYNGIPMGHSTVMFQGEDGRWHRASGGMADGKKSQLGDFDSLEDAIDQYIAVEKANKQTTDDERVDVYDTTDIPFTDRMSWPEYLAAAKKGKRLYHQEKKASYKKKETYSSGSGTVESFTPDKTDNHDEIVIRLKNGKKIVISNNTKLGIRVIPAEGDELGYHGYRINGTNVVHKVHGNKHQRGGWLEPVT